MIISRLLAIFYAFISCVSISPVFADVVVENPNSDLIPKFQGGNVVEAIGKFIEYSVGLASILGVLAITWGGIQMMVAAGDEEKMKKARWIMQYSLIGTAIAGGSYAIISFITNVSF